MRTTQESTRKKLLQSGAREFARNGFAGTSIDTVSLSAGFGKGTVYNYFKSKLDLLLAVVKMVIKDLNKEIDTAIEDISDPELKLKAAVKTDFRFFEKNSSLMVTLLKESYNIDHKKQNRFLEASNPVFDIYSSLIKEGINAGVYSKNTEPYTTAIMIMAMCEDLAISNIILDGSLGTSEKLVDGIINSIFHGIKKQ